MAGALGILFVGAMKASWDIGYSLSSMSVLLFMAIGVMWFGVLRFLPRDIENLNAVSRAGFPAESAPAASS